MGLIIVSALLLLLIKTLVHLDLIYKSREYVMTNKFYNFGDKIYGENSIKFISKCHICLNYQNF